MRIQTKLLRLPWASPFGSARRLPRLSENEPKVVTVEPAKTSHVARRPSMGRVAVLLATARVNVRDRAGEFHSACALIDQGSETSIVTEAFAQRMRRTKTIAVFRVRRQQTGVAKGQISMSIKPRFGGRALIVLLYCRDSPFTRA